MKKFIYLLFIGLTITFVGCSDDNDGVGVRIRNVSEFDFENVKFYIGGIERNFESIKSGQTTEYLNSEYTYSYTGISAEINGELYRHSIIDYVGEPTFTTGSFTFEVGVDKDPVNLPQGWSIQDYRAMYGLDFNSIRD